MRRLARKVFTTYILPTKYLSYFQTSSTPAAPVSLSDPTSHFASSQGTLVSATAEDGHSRSCCALILLQGFRLPLPQPPHFQCLQKLLKQEALDKKGRFLSLPTKSIGMSEHYVQESSFLPNTPGGSARVAKTRL